MRIVRLRR